MATATGIASVVKPIRLQAGDTMPSPRAVTPTEEYTDVHSQGDPEKDEHFVDPFVYDEDPWGGIALT